MLRLTSHFSSLACVLSVKSAAPYHGIEGAQGMVPNGTDHSSLNSYNIPDEIETVEGFLSHMNFIGHYLVNNKDSDERQVQINGKHYLVRQHSSNDLHDNYSALGGEKELRKIYYLYCSTQRCFTIEDPISVAGTLYSFLMNYPQRRGDFYGDGGSVNVTVIRFVLKSIFPTILNVNQSGKYFTDLGSKSVIVQGGSRDKPEVAIDFGSVRLSTSATDKAEQNVLLAKFLKEMLQGPHSDKPLTEDPEDTESLPGIISSLMKPEEEGVDGMQLLQQWIELPPGHEQTDMIPIKDPKGAWQDEHVFRDESLSSIYRFADGPYNTRIVVGREESDGDDQLCTGFKEWIMGLEKSDIQVIESSENERYKLGLSTLSAHQLMNNVPAIQSLRASYICREDMIVLVREPNQSHYESINTDVKNEEFLKRLIFVLLASLKELESFNVGIEGLSMDQVYVVHGLETIEQLQLNSVLVQQAQMLVGGVDRVKNKLNEGDKDQQAVAPPARHMRLLAGISYYVLTNKLLAAAPADAKNEIATLEVISEEGKDFLDKLVRWFSCSEHALQHDWFNNIRRIADANLSNATGGRTDDGNTNSQSE